MLKSCETGILHILVNTWDKLVFRAALFVNLWSASMQQQLTCVNQPQGLIFLIRSHKILSRKKIPIFCQIEL